MKGFKISKKQVICFAHDAAYANSKYLAKKTVSVKILKDRANEIALNPKHDWYQRGLARRTKSDKQTQSEYKWSATSTFSQTSDLKNWKKGKSIRGLRIIFGQLI